MIRGIYTIRDEASATYMALQLNENNDVAIRNFDYAMVNNEMMKFSPSDFSLWYIGDYDDETGLIEAKNPLKLKVGVKRGRK